MPPPKPSDPQPTAETLPPQAQRFLDRHVRYPLGRPNQVRQAEQARRQGRVLATPGQLVGRLAAVDAVLKRRAQEIPAASAKALGDEIAAARAALTARQWSTAELVIEQAEGMAARLPPPPPRPKAPLPPDPRLQKLLKERQDLAGATAKDVKSIADQLTSPYAKKADRDKLLSDCETDSDSDFGRIVAVFDIGMRDSYDTIVARYIEAKRGATKYIKDHPDPKLGKLPSRVLKRRQACERIIADVDRQLNTVGEQNLAAVTLARRLAAQVAKGDSVPFEAATELRKLLSRRLLSDETRHELQLAVDAIDRQERQAGYAALARLPADAGDRERAEVLARHGCFKGSDGGTSDVRLLQNPDGSIAYAFKSVAGESQGGLDFLGLGKGASSMREDVASTICAEIASATRGRLDFGFPASRLVALDGAPGALIEGVNGEMADPEEKNGLMDYERKHGAAAAQKKRDAIDKACRELPDKVSADSLQNVVLSSVMTCQWDCKWGNMIVQGDRARPIDGGTAIPTPEVIRSFMEDKGGPPSMDGYIRYPAYHPKAGDIMPTARQPMAKDKVDAILGLDPARIAAQARARRDQLLRDFPDLDPALMDDSCIDIVQASMQAAKDIVAKNRQITLEGFVAAYEAWFIDHYEKHVKA